MPLVQRGWEAELADVEAYQARRRKAQAQIANMADPRAVAKRTAQLRRAFPHLPPGVIYPYATSPINFNDATLKHLSEMDLKARGARGDFTNPGESTTGASQAQAAAQKVESQLQKQYPGINTATLSGVNTTASGVPDAAFQQYKGAQKTLSTGGGGFLDELTSDLPVVSAVKAIAQGKSPVDVALATVPGTHLISEAQQGIMGAAGSLPVVGSSIKGASRAAFIAADTPLSFINASVRTAASRIDQVVHGGPVFSPEAPQQQIVDTAKQTQGGQALGAALRGDNVDVGAGFFPDPQSATGQAAAEQARVQSPFLIGGHAFTPGRYIANSVFTPDTDPYNFLSGAVDAAVTFKADPFNQAAGVYSEIRADNIAQPAIIGEQVAAEQGGAFDGLRKWVEPKTATNWFSTGDGAKVVDYHVANGGPDLVAARDAASSAQDQIYQLIGANAPESQIEQARTAFQDATKTHTELLGNAIRDSWTRYGKQGPIDMHQDLAYAQTPDQVHDVLDQNLGTSLREFPNPRKFRPNWKPALDQQRWAQVMPDWNAGVTPADTERSVANADLWMRGVKMPATVQDEIIGRIALADNPADYSDLMVTMGDRYADHLVTQGVPQGVADRAKFFFPGSENSDLRKYAVDADTGLAPAQPFMVKNGQGELTPSPMLGSELLNTSIPFPNARTGRELTTAMGALKARATDLVETLTAEREDLLTRSNAARAEGNTTGAQTLSDLADSKVRSIVWAKAKAAPVKIEDAMEAGTDWFVKLWKKTHLARPALGIRINLDAQAQIWAHGMSGLLNDPVHALSIVVGADPESRLGRMLARIAESDTPLVSRVAERMGVLGADAHGVPFAFQDDSQFAEALNGTMGKVMETDAPKGGAIAVRAPTARNYMTVDKSSPTYASSVADEVLRLRSDPIAREIARAGSPEAAKAWMSTPEGSKVFEDWVAHPNRMAYSAADAAPKLVGEMSQAERKAMADWYVDVVYSRLHGISQGDQRILDAIRTGNLDGHTIGISGDSYTGTVKKVNDLAANGWNGPSQVRSPLTMTQGIEKGRARILDTMIYQLAGRPTAYLSSSPVFKQLYYKRLIEEMGAALSPEAKAALLHNVEDGSVKLTRDLELKLRGLPTTPNGLALGEADQLAKNYALHGYSTILHDLGQRRQLWDQLRLLVPFGDAYQLVLTRWANALRDNPMVLRRFGQAITQGRQSGFFQKDTFGQEVFKYPGSEWLTDKLIGVPVPITGSLQGINIAGEGLPGVGPAVSLPAAYLLPNKPSWDGIRSVIFPFGEQQGQTPLDKIVGALEPTWAGHALTFWQTPDGSREFASTVGYLMNELASSGDYKLHGANAEDEANRLLADATSAAKKFALVRAGYSFTAPSAPIPRWLFNDKSNNLAEQQIVRDQYYNRVEDPKVGPDKAFQWLIDTYGDKNFLLAQGFSQSNGIIPRTKSQWDWVRNHDWSQSRYPESYGILVPPDPKGSFDIASYVTQEQAGKVGLPLEPGLGMTKGGRIALANNRLGNLRYDREAAKIALDDPDRQAKLAAIKAQIKTDLPGYAVQKDDFHTTERRIVELQAASMDTRLARANPGIYASLRDYLARRQQVQDASKAQLGRPDSWLRQKNQSAVDLRNWLRQKAQEIMKEHPEFVAAWDRVFAKEMTADTSKAQSATNQYALAP